MIPDVPLYNSRLILIFVEYLKKEYPHIELGYILKKSNIKMYEIDDPGHWFTQAQCDKFYELVRELVEDESFERHAGRNIISCDTGLIKQFVLGLLTPGALYNSLEKLYPNMSRSVNSKVIKKKNNEIDVVVTLKEGLTQKPYQCEVAIGILESLPQLFNDNNAEVKHTRCIHKGDDHCRFNVKWNSTKSLLWLKLRNYNILFSLLLTCIAPFFFSVGTLLQIIAGCCFSTLVLNVISDSFKKRELSEVIITQGNTAKDLLDEAYIHNSYSQLMQNISLVTSKTQNIYKIASSVAEIIKNHFQYDIAHILLVDHEQKQLNYKAGFGLTEKQERAFKKSHVSVSGKAHLMSNIYTRVFDKKEPALHNTNHFSKDTSELDIINLSECNNASFICVPIVFKDNCFGLLTVCNTSVKKKLEQSDLSFLIGVASQTALSIINAKSLKKIDENEKNYRKNVILAQENERRKIAYDLHDNVAQDLGYLKIKCNLILSEFSDIPSDIHGEINTLSNSLQKTITSLRDIAYDIQPPGFDQFGLTQELIALCNNFSTAHSIDIDFLPVGLNSLTLDFDIKINIYRIIAEALTNIHKHAKATHVVINLTASHPLVIVKIKDNGVGFNVKNRLSDAVHKKRMGIKSMDERTRLLNGRFKISSRLGSGTQIMIEIPIEQEYFLEVI